MKPKTRSLAVIAPKLPITQPPPHKKDIINALVERARVKHQEHADVFKNKRLEAEQFAKDAILKELVDNPSNFRVRVSPEYNHPEIEYSLEVVPPHIKKLRDAIRAAPLISGFDAAAAVRRDITNKMAQGSSDRVAALLASPEAVKKLDETLQSLGLAE